MEDLTKETTKYQRKDLEHELKKDFASALKNEDFKKLVNTLKLPEDIAYKYTSKLERTVCELGNCKNCKSLHMCKNKMQGMVFYPKVVNNKLDFNYVACKYKKKDNALKEEIRSKFFEMPYDIKMARLKDIEISANRSKVIKWINKFYDDFKANKTVKGLYLSGSFGSGKTFILSALLNELSKDKYSSIIVYYPELLRSIKESFNTESEDYRNRINEIKKCDLLLLDDIGAETCTSWNRDEILGTILQYRMDNKKATFFSSNLNIKELENHFILNQKEEEQIKSRRIMERIKFLTEELELIGENRRK